MFEFILFGFYGILSVTATHNGLALTIPKKITIKDLALELVVEDNNKDNGADTESTTRDNVETIIDNDNNFRRNYKHLRIDKFTDFIQLVIETLNKFEDDDFENFFTILDNEINKYHYNGCKFHELADNYGFKKFMASKSHVLRNITANKMRQNIQKLADKIQKAEYDELEKELIDYINSLYRQDSVEKLNKFLMKIDNLRLKNKMQIDLIKIVREGMRSIIFNHYTKLDYNTRAELKSQLDRYWEHIMPIPRAHRPQFNAKEVQLLENQNKDDGTFYFTTKHIHDSKQSKHLKQEFTFKTLYPKLVEWVMNSGPPKPLKSASPRPNNPETIGLESDQLDSDTEINDPNSDVRTVKNRHVTETMFRQKHDSSNDDANAHLATEVEIRDKEMELEPTEHLSDLSTEITEVQLTHSTPKMRRYTKKTNKKIGVIKAPLTSLPQKHHDDTDTVMDKPPIISNRFVLNTTAPILERDTKKIPTAKSMLRTVETHKHYIEVATLKAFIPKKIINSKKMIYEIDIRKPRIQKRFQVLSRNFSSVPKIHKPNEDSTIIHEGLSIELKEEGAQRKYYNDHLPADAVVIAEDVLTRLQELENELKDVKTVVNNDTKMIQNLKHNIELEEGESENGSKEFILAKVIHCNDTYNNEKQTQNDERQLMHNYSGHRRVLSEENRSLKHFSTEESEKVIRHKYNTDSDLERDEMSYMSKPVYNKHNNIANYFNSNNDISSNGQVTHSRSAMIDKVKEIKKKLDTANKSNEKYRRNSYLSAETNTDFRKDFIPGKDTFHENMKTLENYLNFNKININKDSEKDKYVGEKYDKTHETHFNFETTNVDL